MYAYSLHILILEIRQLLVHLADTTPPLHKGGLPSGAGLASEVITI